jgi:hypothetical protein
VNAKELAEHLEFLDGIQKAQMLVLRALLRQQPELKEKLNLYATQLDSNPPAQDMSTIQLEAMQTHLLALTQ